jgi:hypothetical protein
MKIKFSTRCLSEFWFSLQDEAEELCLKAVNILIPFAAFFLRESGFSAVATVKWKYRSKVNVK